MDMQIEQMSEEEREEIVRYGIKRGKVILTSTLITIMLGCLLGIVWQSIIFWFSLSILRKYAGGYHADTENNCYVISLLVVLVSLMCIKCIHNDWIVGILQPISLFIIFVLAPVENNNHLLDMDEKMLYGTRTKIIEVALCFTYVFLYFIDKQNAAISIGIANIAVAASLLFGCAKNHRLNCIKSE